MKHVPPAHQQIMTHVSRVANLITERKLEMNVNAKPVTTTMEVMLLVLNAILVVPLVRALDQIIVQLLAILPSKELFQEPPAFVKMVTMKIMLNYVELAIKIVKLVPMDLHCLANRVIQEISDRLIILITHVSAKMDSMKVVLPFVLNAIIHVQHARDQILRIVQNVLVISIEVFLLMANVSVHPIIMMMVLMLNVKHVTVHV